MRYIATKKPSSDSSADAVKRISSKAPSESRYDNRLKSTAGNCLTLQFAKTALTQLDLGKRDRTDLLNICLDAPRAIREAYGPESIEAEDMYYRLDQDLEEFLTYVYTLFKPHEVLVILTSDHGSSPSYDFGREACDRFNTRQFEVIVNGFLSARYGPGNWVLEYEDKCLYLNHNLVYEKDLSLADIQNEVATFAMQFRGVSHALSATAMRTSYFGSGYARKMQNSFYPRRSGDVIINLMPGWIEEHDHKRSSSGSMYGYDTEVPLVFYGKGAGKLPTASAVISDVIDCTKASGTIDTLFWQADSVEACNRQLLDWQQIPARFYLRLRLSDPQQLAYISLLLDEYKLLSRPDQPKTEIALVTSTMTRRCLQEILAQLQAEGIVPLNTLFVLQ